MAKKRATSKQLVTPIKGTASNLRDATKAIKLATRNLEKTISLLCEEKVTWIKQVPAKKKKKARKK